MSKWIFWSLFAAVMLLISLQPACTQEPGKEVRVEKAISADKVEIAYTSHGSGETALIFIHGGLADQEYWRNQVEPFAQTYQVITLDLAGHGQSGKNRQKYSMEAFARDVIAVIEKEKINRAVLVGNSLGGPVALEMALLMPDKILGIVAVDTFQALDRKPPADYLKEIVRMIRTDFDKFVRQMATSLLSKGDKNPLYPEIVKKMLTFSPEIALAMIKSSFGYDLSATAKKVPHPIRCINSNTYPTLLEKNRGIHADFDAVIIPASGHYPMLEQPEVFNRNLKNILAEFLERK
jgi:pimeloyl-ACP methyl ester carboxylesterase